MCVEDCNGRGRCIQGKCECSSKFVGLACEKMRCLNECSGNGNCIASRGECDCYKGY
jgi:syndecan 4